MTKIWISLALARCGGGLPSNLTGIRSLVGLACCTTSCGMIRLFGRLGDFGDLCSGVGGSTSIRILVANDAGGRFGIGLSNGGVCLFGIGTSAMLASFSFTMTFTKSPLFWTFRNENKMEMETAINETRNATSNKCKAKHLNVCVFRFTIGFTFAFALESALTSMCSMESFSSSSLKLWEKCRSLCK